MCPRGFPEKPQGHHNCSRRYHPIKTTRRAAHVRVWGRGPHSPTTWAALKPDRELSTCGLNGEPLRSKRGQALDRRTTRQESGHDGKRHPKRWGEIRHTLSDSPWPVGLTMPDGSHPLPCHPAHNKPPGRPGRAPLGGNLLGDDRAKAGRVRLAGLTVQEKEVESGPPLGPTPPLLAEPCLSGCPQIASLQKEPGGILMNIFLL